MGGGVGRGEGEAERLPQLQESLVAVDITNLRPDIEHVSQCATCRRGMHIEQDFSVYIVRCGGSG